VYCGNAKAAPQCIALTKWTRLRRRPKSGALKTSRHARADKGHSTITKASLACHRVKLRFAFDTDEIEEEDSMRLQTGTPRSSAFTSFLSLPVCSNCQEKLLAPILSEFIDGGEIRHHWTCDVCGSVTQTSIDLMPH
jgi:hypothetical protein